MSPRDRDRLKVTRNQIEENFAAIEERATPGIYPGAGPRTLYGLEVDALRNHPDCSVLWAAACGANFSMGRAAFQESGGFDEDLDINEHRELALRLCADGHRMVFVEGAKSYHLTHRTGWRDPLTETGWEAVFYRRHPILAVKLLAVFWATISENRDLPPDARISSLPELELRAQGEDGIDYDAIRTINLGLPSLSVA